MLGYDLPKVVLGVAASTSAEDGRLLTEYIEMLPLVHIHLALRYQVEDSSLWRLVTFLPDSRREILLISDKPTDEEEVVGIFQAAANGEGRHGWFNKGYNNDDTPMRSYYGRDSLSVPNFEGQSAAYICPVAIR